MACLMNFTMGCLDVDSGQRGVFLFDTDHWQRTGEFKSIGPVFPGLVEFFQWDDDTGPLRASCYLERLTD